MGIMLGLVDRSDEGASGQSSHCSSQAGQGSEVMPGTRRVSSGVPWQPNPAEEAEGEPLGMVRIVSLPMVPIEHRPAVPVVEPREYRARRFHIRREVELRRSRTVTDAVSASGRL